MRGAISNSLAPARKARSAARWPRAPSTFASRRQATSYADLPARAEVELRDEMFGIDALQAPASSSGKGAPMNAVRDRSRGSAAREAARSAQLTISKAADQ